MQVSSARGRPLIHLDTSFLVDLLREGDRNQRGPARQFLEAHKADQLEMSVPVVCELHAGAACSRDPGRERARIESIVRSIPVVYIDEHFALRYADLYAELRRTGTTVPAMDLLIGTSAILRSATLVTRNVRDFRRIPGLRLVSYGS